MNKRRVFVLGALAAGAGAAHWRTHQAPAPPAVPHDAAIAALRATDDSDGFAHAEAARTFAFPRDHGPHGDFRAEWWYFTGHLHTSEGRPFGFQLTVFRYELDAATIASSSAWRTPRVLLAHFALSDIAGHAFHPFERCSRAVPAVAGVRADPLALWLDDWRIEYAADRDCWHLSAAQEGIALTLQLDSASAIVLQADKDPLPAEP